jgi:hypothetical protein
MSLFFSLGVWGHTQGVCIKLDYIGEFDAIFKTAFAPEWGGEGAFNLRNTDHYKIL